MAQIETCLDNNSIFDYLTLNIHILCPVRHHSVWTRAEIPRSSCVLPGPRGAAIACHKVWFRRTLPRQRCSPILTSMMYIFLFNSILHEIYHTVNRLQSFLSLGHLVTWSLGHWVTRSLGHSSENIFLLKYFLYDLKALEKVLSTRIMSS